MSKVWIDKYMNWDIHFDTDNETFSAECDHFDHRTAGRVSYAAVKNAIKKYVKENSGFKPIPVVYHYWGNLRRGEIVGMRPDAKLLVKMDDKESSKVINAHELEKYSLMGNQVAFEEAVEKIEELDEKARRLKEQSNQVEKDYLKTLKPLVQSYIALCEQRGLEPKLK